MLKPELEFVYEAEGLLGTPVPVGDTPDGTRRIIPIFKGGRVEGPLIKGSLLGDVQRRTLCRRRPALGLAGALKSHLCAKDPPAGASGRFNARNFFSQN